MRAFYHPDQALHDPLQFMRYGKLVSPKDVPERTAKLLGALERRGVKPERPSALGKAPALSVHTQSYLDFLETVWERWETLPDHGPDGRQYRHLAAQGEVAGAGAVVRVPSSACLREKGARSLAQWLAARHRGRIRSSESHRDARFLSSGSGPA